VARDLTPAQCRREFPDAFETWVDDYEDKLKVLDDAFTIADDGSLWAFCHVAQPAYRWDPIMCIWTQPDTSMDDE
jgi:hypothetical protein